MSYNTQSRIVVCDFLPKYYEYEGEEFKVSCCLRGKTLLVVFGSSSQKHSSLLKLGERKMQDTLNEDLIWADYGPADYEGGAMFQLAEGELDFCDFSTSLGKGLTPEMEEVARSELVRLLGERGIHAS